MQRAGKAVIFVLLFLALFIIVVFCSLANLPFSRIDGYQINGIASYSIKSIVAKARFDSYLTIDVFSLKNRIKDLAYVEDVGLSFSENRLTIDVYCKEKGVVICSEAGNYFFDGSGFLAIDGKDLRVLKDIYLSMSIDGEYMMYMKDFGFTTDFVDVLDFLYNLGDSGILITRVEYDNNKSTGKGILNLYFPSLNSTLIVEDFTKLSYIDECIGIISDEFIQYRYDTMFSDRLYGLRSSGLVRIKR